MINGNRILFDNENKQKHKLKTTEAMIERMKELVNDKVIL